MNILPVDRALIIYGALADRSETKGARERLSRHLMKMYLEGRRGRAPLDGGRAVLPSQAESGNRFQKLGQLPSLAYRCFRREFCRVIVALAARTASLSRL
jgi:hypothetical protein